MVKNIDSFILSISQYSKTYYAARHCSRHQRCISETFGSDNKVVSFFFSMISELNDHNY